MFKISLITASVICESVRVPPEHSLKPWMLLLSQELDFYPGVLTWPTCDKHDWCPLWNKCTKKKKKKTGSVHFILKLSELQFDNQLFCFKSILLTGCTINLFSMKSVNLWAPPKSVIYSFSRSVGWLHFCLGLCFCSFDWHLDPTWLLLFFFLCFEQVVLIY